jgi:uncharacterized protein YdhG (YjbR/CyaY superfamily)/L-ascorbate metabolism protein UlaG (beta-lactamase superfamily)
MEITYIGHSGFLMEWEDCYWLFDYYKGNIPEMKPDKKIFVFVSHKHSDHYNPEIFGLYNRYRDLEYVLSSDINPSKLNFTRLGVTKEIAERILSVKPSGRYELFDRNKEKIALTTLKSTDCGVAFLLQYQGKTVYHAGDLNLWIWSGESKQYNNNMMAKYHEIISSLKDLPVDVAFVPLDPRLEENYYMGLESLINTAKVRYAFPMHFFDKPSVIRQFKNERAANIHDTRIMDIFEEGQKWELDMDKNTNAAQAIDEYIAQFPAEIRERLVRLRKVIREAAPAATEKISYQMPTFFLNGNLVHFAAFKKHIGFFPSPSAVVAFEEALKEYPCSKGTIQFPYSKPLPYDLVTQIVKFRVAENTGKAEAKKKAK